MVKRNGNNRRKSRQATGEMGRPKGRTATENTTLRLEPELKQEVVRVSKEEDRSVSSTLRLLIREALAVRKKRSEKRR